MSDATLRPIVHDEPFDLWSAQLDATLGEGRWAEALAGLVARLGEAGLGRRWLVLELPTDLEREQALAGLAAAGRGVEELLVVVSEAERLAYGALGAGDVRGLSQRRDLRVVFEADREQALRSTMLRLRAGDRCLVVAAVARGCSLSQRIYRALAERER